ncbi:MAG: OmpA family protein [Steroidobacteraceae bacterium]
MNVAARVEATDAEAIPTFIDLDWESNSHDDGWLVTYADIISTALAMVVLIFGRAALGPAPAVIPTPVPVAAAATASIGAATAEPAGDAAVPSGDASGATMTAAPGELDSRDAADPLAPIEPDATAAEIATPPPAELLAALVSTRFAGRIAAERRNEGVVLTIPAVALFGSARADLSPAARPLLDELAATLREAGDARISVEGHTDDRPVQGGTFRSNWDLAAARANAVTAYLLAHGFSPQRLHSVSYADTRPVVDNGTAEGRAANRRVELAIDFETPRR